MTEWPRTDTAGGLCQRFWLTPITLAGKIFPLPRNRKPEKTSADVVWFAMEQAHREMKQELKQKASVGGVSTSAGGLPGQWRFYSKRRGIFKALLS